MFNRSTMPFSPILASRRLAAAACIAFAFCMTGFTAPKDETLHGSAKVKTALKVVAFGSSSTAGWGASAPSASYPAQLQIVLAKLMPNGRQVDVENRGIGGEDVDDMIGRLQRDVVARKPDVVIWQTGSNDPLRNVPLDRFEAETRDGIATMRKAGATVILMEPQWCPRLDKAGNADAFRDAVRRIGKEMNVAVIRRSDLMRKWIANGTMTKAQMLAPDGLHMADIGYAQLAHDIAPDVLRAGAVEIAQPTPVASK